ncbi:MAG TPA: hypothetical protein PKH29_10325 [Oscillospiraceae bacterium]|nr:hypothetical protein [Oscillospiraceae bacterium]
MSDEELRIFALSNMQLLIITGIEEGKYADKALEAFELIIKRKKGTPEIYEAYILILELTYQYEKSYDLLLSLLHDGNAKELALNFYHPILIALKNYRVSVTLYLARKN